MARTSCSSMPPHIIARDRERDSPSEREFLPVKKKYCLLTGSFSV